MAQHHNSKIYVCSFSCKSVMNCLLEINRRSVFKEHWPLLTELSLLNGIHPDFLSHGLSAVDITADVLIGRPWLNIAFKQLAKSLRYMIAVPQYCYRTGTAIMYRKDLANCLKVICSQRPCSSSYSLLRASHTV